MRRRGLLTVAASAAAVATVVGISAVWPGLDAAQTPPADSSVWVLQTVDGSSYARVNTAVDELDTVRTIAAPTSLVHSGADAYLFSESFGRVTHIDPAQPIDVIDGSENGASEATPEGTIDAVVQGDFVVYRTNSGAVYAGSLSLGDVQKIEPNIVGASPSGATEARDADEPEYTADAATVDESGLLTSYSAADGEVLRYSVPTGRVEGVDTVVEGPTGDGIAITAVDDRWALIDTLRSTLWVRGRDDAVSLPLAGSVAVGRPPGAGDEVFVADETGLFSISARDGTTVRLTEEGQAAFGQPARPVMADGIITAAWLDEGGGTLWRSDAGRSTPLSYDGEELGEVRRPVLTLSGSTMVLNETRSGWVWTVPEGRLLPSSRNWTLDDNADQQSEPTDEEAPVVVDPRPPVAEPDAFGVRAGSLVSLPVLLNDHDPNDDVLSVEAASITGLDPDVGDVSVTDNGGRLVVDVRPDAVGSATFTYEVTDGTGQPGLVSNRTSVTLTIVPDEQNSAPVWCGTTDCLAEWPTPEVSPGGTVITPVLTGWVDPDGDPVVLLAASTEAGAGAVAATPSGDVVFQHADASRAEAANVPVTVTVSDTRGAAASRSLLVRVSGSPAVTAQSFTVIDTEASGLTVDVAPHVSGTTGSLRLSSVRVLDDAPAEVVPDAGRPQFDFTTSAPGTYRVAYTVTDGVKSAVAIARITILPREAAADLATAPVVAFVRPGEDSTIDVFTAVSNPTRRVLLLSDLQSDVEPGASLQFDAVGQNFIRVTGTTQTGAPGRLGTVSYTVSDGTDDSGSRVRGEATVYLLDPALDAPPIAVDDAVTVRAGAQVDIGVLDNDVPPAGGVVTLNPETVTSTDADALAFASGRTIRYLAPPTPGTHTIEYQVYSAGTPSLFDTATVRVTIVSQESNRDPQPSTLEGRVLSGQATSIPFVRFGIDPDGDAVDLDRVITQPDSGSATVSAAGDAIIYTSVPGFRGQTSFDYRVTDGAGATATGTVNVGVLGEEANPSPVTFTDYVYVQAGESHSVRVDPLANDIDPTGGSLRLTAVRPALAETLDDGSSNPLYESLDALLGEPSASAVEVAAGTQPGTMTFLYDVESASGNTGRGMIVVKVVRERVPDYPVVSDTVLTAETRDRFATGVDVISGKVAWTGGEPGAMSLSLWGDPTGVDAVGRRISGTLTDAAQIIAFSVTGAGADQAIVTSYAFLRIPSADDISLALRPGLPAREVDEAGEVTFDMSELVRVPIGVELEVGADIAASGSRALASCELDGATDVRYDAGRGAPWVDACIVPVRVAGQDSWTFLSVPIRVRATDPVPVLRPASVTVAPGQTLTYALADMTTWQGRPPATGVGYQMDFAGSSLRATLDGDEVTVTAADDAIVGAEEAALVRVTSQPGVAPARLILRVGAAPSSLPRGGTAVQECSQDAGSSCEITVIGAPGEVNPLPNTPLSLESVRPSSACPSVTFVRSSATTVRASWSSDAPGSTCTAAFSVADAQGRLTTGERDGTVVLDLRGFPAAPAAVTQTGYADGIVALTVTPGPAAASYPAASGFVIRSGDAIVAQCAANGACSDITAINGERLTFEAATVNDLGESAGRASTIAWAYDPPASPASVAVRPVVTGGEGGIVSVAITGIDAVETGTIELTSAVGDTVQFAVEPGTDSLDVPRYRIGSNTATPLTVTPYSRFALPPGLPGSATGAGVTVSANGIGQPLSPALTLSSVARGDGTSLVEAAGAASSGGDGSEVRFGISAVGSTCQTSPGGQSRSFSGLPDGVVYPFQLCVESWAGGVLYGRTSATAEVRAAQNSSPPRGYTFRVDAAPEVAASSARWMIRSAPTSNESPPRFNVAEFAGGPPSDVYDRDPGVRVRYVHSSWGTTTEFAEVGPANGSAPYQVRASWALSTCVAGGVLAPVGESSVDESGRGAQFTFDLSAARFVDDAGIELPFDLASGLVPLGAVSVTSIGVSASWSAQGWGLDDVTSTLGGACDPGLPAIPVAP